MEFIFTISIGGIVGYFIKYILDKKLFLYKKKIRAREKVRKFVGIFAKSRFFYAHIRILDIEKIKNFNEFERTNQSNNICSIHRESFFTIQKELNQLSIYSEVIPYVNNKTKKILEACLCLLTNAVPYMLWITLDDSIINKESLKANFEKDIIPVISEHEKIKLIKSDPIKYVWLCDDLLSKKLSEVSKI